VRIKVRREYGRAGVVLLKLTELSGEPFGTPRHRAALRLLRYWWQLPYAETSAALEGLRHRDTMKWTRGGLTLKSGRGLLPDENVPGSPGARLLAPVAAAQQAIRVAEDARWSDPDGWAAKIEAAAHKVRRVYPERYAEEG